MGKWYSENGLTRTCWLGWLWEYTGISRGVSHTRTTLSEFGAGACAHASRSWNACARRGTLSSLNGLSMAQTLLR
jgi:hypothetical protein